MMGEVMWLQGTAERTNGNSDRRKGCVLGHRDMPREFLVWDCGQFSSSHVRELQEKKQDARRRRVGMDGGENRFLGGSDPTLSGLEAAQRLRRRGSLPPNLPSGFPRSVAGRVVGEFPNGIEREQPKENNRWP